MCASPGDGAPVRLSRRESEVAGLVAQGLTNREIATKLFLSERTVDGHLEHVREKLGVNTRAQIAAWVVRQDATAIPPSPAGPITRPAPRQRLVSHPRLWVAASLVVAVLAAGVGVLLLTAPAPLTITTIAGSECHHQEYPGGCFGGDNDLATRAYLARPTDIAVDGSGGLYIADFGNSRVRRVRDQTITTVAGTDVKPEPLIEGAIATSVSIGQAGGLAIDSENRLLLLTDVNGIDEVWRVEPQGVMSLVVSIPGPSGASGSIAGPRGPNMPVGGLAVKDGTLFIADRAGNRVWKFAGGQLTPYAGTGDFGYSDAGSATSAKLAWPIGLALDKQGNLYIADAGNSRIRKVDLKGRITTIAGSGSFEGDGGDGGPAGEARLSFPYGIAVSPDGSIVIADTGNHRLRWISTSGFIYPWAGTGQWGFNGDGPALQAQLSGPEAVTFDATGGLLIADTENQRVREMPAPK
jgi:DNA-binding CsgD family transcriptional regulator/DNA-binding beta-propeller fold protein YncE